MTPICSWDWYECTLIGIFDAEPVVQSLGGGLLATRGPAHQNYPGSFVWDLPSGGTVQVWYGAGLEVHVVLSSGACDDLVAVVRRRWRHLVSRVDVAMDFDYAGAFEVIYRGLDGAAQDHKPRPVHSTTFGDWLRAERGRTLYLGARSSRLYMRCYEKGIEQSQAHPDRTFSLDWVRVEWQLRPDSRHKEALSTMTPEEAASSTHFGGTALALLSGVGHPSLPLQRVPSTDPLYWALRQYGAALEALVRSEPEVTVAALLSRFREPVSA